MTWPPHETLLQAAALALLVLSLLQSARLFVAKRLPRWRIARHRKTGARGEARARKLLEAEGYAIEAEQVTRRYELRVDGLPHPVPLRADYLVRRDGRAFIAEVKSGAESARIGNAATRRQLIEYRLAFDVDGILLVDAYAGRIVEVELPRVRSAPQTRSTLFVWVLFALAGAVVWWLSRGG
jgi:hypothetical protein